MARAAGSRSENHLIALGYTNDDDGVWLWCSCGWKQNLGYEPSIATAIFAARQHESNVPLGPVSDR